MSGKDIKTLLSEQGRCLKCDSLVKYKELKDGFCIICRKKTKKAKCLVCKRELPCYLLGNGRCGRCRIKMDRDIKVVMRSNRRCPKCKMPLPPRSSSCPICKL